MVALSAASLGALPAPITVPAYDRSRVRVGVVHLGVGGFHRSHQAVYLDTLMATGRALDWGICGVGVLPGDARMRDVLAAQDCLWTLLVRHPDGFRGARVAARWSSTCWRPTTRRGWWRGWRTRGSGWSR